MTDVKTIEHMWKVASNNPNHDTNWHDPVVIKFAKLIAQHEREECAKVAENMDAMILSLLNETRQPILIAASIRARGEV